MQQKRLRWKQPLWSVAFGMSLLFAATALFGNALSSVDILNGAQSQGTELGRIELRIINLRKRGVSDQGAIRYASQAPALDEIQRRLDPLLEGKEKGQEKAILQRANHALDQLEAD